ncbi:MAG: hypothetical protein KDI09_11995, partial [Halioglobus sp.]|nr:hypothetical protein [Halioglobus sp.]
MKESIMTRSLQCLVLSLLFCFCQPLRALECSSPTLKGASGVIGNKHSYKISGECEQTWSSTTTGAGSSTTVNSAIQFSYLGGASWDRLSGVAEEQLKISGDSTGKRFATATCSQDPFLKDPPGGPAKCGPITVQIDMDAGKIYEALTTKTFWANKKLSLAEAQALSALGSPSKPPSEPQKVKPPAEVFSSRSTPAAVSGDIIATNPGTGTVSAIQAPPEIADRVVAAGSLRSATTGGETLRPPPEGQLRRAGGTAMPALRPIQMEFEAEALVRSGAFQVAGGQVQPQAMAGFGSGWSGGEQLFWSGGAVGAVLDLVIEVPAGSKYAVEIYMTRAPDYGLLQFEIDGTQSDMTFDGMAPEVMTSGPYPLGTFPIQAGTRRISLMIIGKYSQSGGYYVGIDKLR